MRDSLEFLLAGILRQRPAAAEVPEDTSGRPDRE